MHDPTRTKLAAALCVALAAGAAPALAQPITDELTITAHPGPDTMSYHVGYRDIDLRTKDGRDELGRRVNVTAEYLCKKLSPNNDVVACAQQAVTEAAPQIRAAEDHAIAAVKWTRGPAWTPPPSG